MTVVTVVTSVLPSSLCGLIINTVLDWIPAQFRSRTQLRRPELQMFP